MHPPGLAHLLDNQFSPIISALEDSLATPSTNKEKWRGTTCHKHRRHAAAATGLAPFYIQGEPRQLPGEAQIPHFPSVHSAFLSGRLPSRGSGVGADFSPRTAHVGRFSRRPADARGMPCGGASVRHCHSAKSRMLDGKIRAVVIHRGAVAGQGALSRRPDTLPSWNRQQCDVDEWMCVLLWAHGAPSPAGISLLRGGGSLLGDKVAVRTWPSSRCVSSLAVRVHCGSIFWRRDTLAVGEVVPGVAGLARHCPPACRSKDVNGSAVVPGAGSGLFRSVRVRVNGTLFPHSLGQRIHRACAGTGWMQPDRHIHGDAPFVLRCCTACGSAGEQL
ncbi:hypothetical protein TcBrA4_0041210 [Trypanosoma cruzi]|nr:hypothetical protein TcBrA4_0041210 [Trypanosoma cruzi]